MYFKIFNSSKAFILTEIVQLFIILYHSCVLQYHYIRGKNHSRAIMFDKRTGSPI